MGDMGYGRQRFSTKAVRRHALQVLKLGQLGGREPFTNNVEVVFLCVRDGGRQSRSVSVSVSFTTQHSTRSAAQRTAMPQPSSWICSALSPPDRADTVILVDPASKQFSMSSFRADAGRTTTSPAAMRFTTASSNRWIRRRAPSVSPVPAGVAAVGVAAALEGAADAAADAAAVAVAATTDAADAAAAATACGAEDACMWGLIVATIIGAHSSQHGATKLCTKEKTHTKTDPLTHIKHTQNTHIHTYNGT